MAICAEAFQVIQTGRMAGLHVRNMGTVVMDFDAGRASFVSILLHWIKPTAFAEQSPMVGNETCTLFRSKARLSLLLQMDRNPRISLDPGPLLVSRDKRCAGICKFGC